MKNNNLVKTNRGLGAMQMALDLGVEIQKDINGIEMGVLENGMPFLTQRGLAGICGQSHKRIYDISNQWEEHYHDEVISSKDRISFIREYLFTNGYKEPKLYIECNEGAKVTHAFPEIVCMAILEFYAFESRVKTQEAIGSYRKLSRFGLQEFIYKSLSYTPNDKWKYYLDRFSLLENKIPAGYFTIFQEIATMVVSIINSGLTVNDKTIPDISVGRTWASRWTSNNLSNEFGERIEYEHNYPSYYPQASSNPQSPWAYPDAALPAFRKWFKQDYLTTKFPRYILVKANVLPGGKNEALGLAGVFNKEHRTITQEEE